ADRPGVGAAGDEDEQAEDLPHRRSIARMIRAMFAVNPRWSDLPRVNALLHGFPRDYLVHDYRTTLSVKSVVAGAARYATPNGRYLVTPDVFLVLNHGQRYSMEVAAESRTATVGPFFAPGCVGGGAAALAAGDARQLDGAPPARPLELCERLYPMSGPVGALLDALRRADGREALEDGFHDLALALATPRDDVRRATAP